MLINPAVSISANLEECVAVAPLDVRARLQLRQVNILPLAALGLVLDRGDCVVIVGNLNEVAVGPFCALDIDFNGNTGWPLMETVIALFMSTSSSLLGVSTPCR